MTYHHKDGMIYDTEDGQTIATMSESATPEEASILAAAPRLLAALEALHFAVTMRPIGHQLELEGLQALHGLKILRGTENHPTGHHNVKFD